MHRWISIGTGIIGIIFGSTNVTLAQTYTIVTPVGATAEVNNADAPKTIDNNPNECNLPTYWQAALDPQACITFDLGTVLSNVAGLQESAGPFPGNPFAASASADGVNYGSAISGTLTSLWPSGSCAFGQHFFPAPTNVRFIRLCVQRTDDTGFGELADFRALVQAVTSPAYSCSGFEPPFDASILLKSKVNRAIPLKMQLFDNGTPITDLNIDRAAPVVNVMFSAGGGPAIDVTDQLDPLGQSSEGNEFRFDASAGHWVFNLGTKPYTAPGTYTVTAAPGDTSYTISPTCTGQFVRSD